MMGIFWDVFMGALGIFAAIGIVLGLIALGFLIFILLWSR